MRACMEKISGRDKPTQGGSYDSAFMFPTHEMIAAYINVKASPEREDEIQETKIVVCSRKICGGTNIFSCLLGVYVRVSPYPFLRTAYELSFDGVVSPAWICLCPITARVFVHCILARHRQASLS